MQEKEIGFFVDFIWSAREIKEGNQPEWEWVNQEKEKVQGCGGERKVDLEHNNYNTSHPS